MTATVKDSVTVRDDVTVSDSCGGSEAGLDELGLFTAAQGHSRTIILWRETDLVHGKVVRRVHVTLDAATVTETILTRDGPTPVAGIDFGLAGIATITISNNRAGYAEITDPRWKHSGRPNEIGDHGCRLYPRD